MEEHQTNKQFTKPQKPSMNLIPMDNGWSLLFMSPNGQTLQKLVFVPQLKDALKSMIGEFIDATESTASENGPTDTN